MTDQPIKVLVFDASAVFRNVMIEGLRQDRGIDVVGWTDDPWAVQDLLDQLKPDLITWDINCPRVNSIDFIRQLVKINTLPVVAICSDLDYAYDILDAGAVDLILKPNARSSPSIQAFIQELIRAIKNSAQARIYRYMFRNPFL